MGQRLDFRPKNRASRYDKRVGMRPIWPKLQSKLQSRARTFDRGACSAPFRRVGALHPPPPHTHVHTRSHAARHAYRVRVKRSAGPSR